MDAWLIALIAIVGFIVVRFLVALAMCGGDVGLLKLAIRTDFRLMRDRAFAAKVADLLEPPPPPPPPKPSGAPLRLLALFQRQGRLIDFLQEDIQGYANEQIGAAVRDIHRQCREVLKEHLVLERVLPQEEQSSVEVPAGFDPSAIQLTGNVTGQPPFRGTLRHHGWRVREIKLGPVPEGQDEFVLQPAEVEL